MPIDIIRLTFAVLTFLLALLAVFPAPTNLFWKISVAVTEWGHILAIIILLPFLFPWWHSLAGKTAFCFALAGFILACTPVIRGYKVDAQLPAQLRQAFGTAPEEKKIISFKNLFTGVPYKKVAYERLRYSSDNSPELVIDLYKSSVQTSKSPCVIIVHGGAWEGGDSRQLPALNSYLVGKGYTVAAITYRLAPEYIAPAASDDVQKAVEFIKKNSERFNIDSTKLALLGRSAGGQVALVAGYSMNDPCIKGLIAFYTPADMVWGYSLPGNPLILDSRKVLSAYLGGSYEKVPQNYEKATAMNYVNAHTPPTLMLHGQKDEMVAYEHNIRLKKVLDQYGVKNTIVTLPWATHGFDYNFSGPGAQISTYSIEYFLKYIFR
ncbi:MAG: alpha/beta hydrolase fold domain-containing protein [Cytophagaceae bacterium]